MKQRWHLIMCTDANFVSYANSAHIPWPFDIHTFVRLLFLRVSKAAGLGSRLFRTIRLHRTVVSTRSLPGHRFWVDDMLLARLIDSGHRHHCVGNKDKKISKSISSKTVISINSKLHTLLKLTVLQEISKVHPTWVNIGRVQLGAESHVNVDHDYHRNQEQHGEVEHVINSRTVTSTVHDTNCFQRLSWSSCRHYIFLLRKVPSNSLTVNHVEHDYPRRANRRRQRPYEDIT